MTIGAEADRPRGARSGYTLIEAMIVIVLLSIMLGFLVTRIRVTPRTKVRQAASLLVRDLELARTRALATISHARVTFDVPGNAYSAYLDADQDRVIAESAAEAQALRGFGTRVLANGVRYGRGGAGPLPDFADPGDITFADNRVEFDTRGITAPLGTRGVVYLTHPDDPSAVAAVSVSGAAGIRAWTFQEGAWR